MKEKNFWYLLSNLEEVPKINIHNTYSLKTLKNFFDNTPGWEYSFYDSISYNNTIELFSWKQIARVLEYVDNLIYCTPSIDELNNIIFNKKINQDLRRIIFYNLYVYYKLELVKLFGQALWTIQIKKIFQSIK